MARRATWIVAGQDLSFGWFAAGMDGPSIGWIAGCRLRGGAPGDQGQQVNAEPDSVNGDADSVNEPPSIAWSEEDTARILEAEAEASPAPWQPLAMAEARPGRNYGPEDWGVFLPDGSTPHSQADAILKAAGRNDLPRAVRWIDAVEALAAERIARRRLGRSWHA